MRKLLYVPIIHAASDMGSVAPDIEGRSATLCGADRWAKHKQTVAGFWQSLAHYFSSLDASNLNIYQDGLPAEGELGKRIVEEGARLGSENHRIILSLMGRGAEIRKTEDPSLLTEEYGLITRLIRARSPIEKARAYVGYRCRKDRLLRKRDSFAAKMIDETLRQGEKGVLFMGTQHDVLAYLPRDIAVERLKDRRKVNAYLKELASKGDGKEFGQLAEYLVSPCVWSPKGLEAGNSH